MATVMEVQELRNEIVPRLDRIEASTAATNGRVSKLEMFKAVVQTVGILGVVVFANGAAWVVLMMGQ